MKNYFHRFIEKVKAYHILLHCFFWICVIANHPSKYNAYKIHSSRGGWTSKAILTWPQNIVIDLYDLGKNYVDICLYFKVKNSKKCVTCWWFVLLKNCHNWDGKNFQICPKLRKRSSAHSDTEYVLLGNITISKTKKLWNFWFDTYLCYKVQALLTISRRGT